ncbi:MULTISPECIES: trimeric intracellular cation channel family protein [unclassified Acinetobacter]|uniref:trimeric intracellular cation channel family protein n=1 Tax=unclassified Acinetobacter TaxID=196816 RepID=UPI0035B74D1E
MPINDLTLWGETLRIMVEVIGTLAFAVSGVLSGMRKRMDVFGVAVLGFLAAFGGGTLRDILLDIRPFFWVSQEIMLWLVFSLCIFMMFANNWRKIHITPSAIQFADALGLGLFVAAGVQAALATGIPMSVAVIMGIITGVFGGVMRDIACGEMPTAFFDRRPYAMCALVGGWVHAFLAVYSVLPSWLVLLISASTITGLRICVIVFDYRLPDWHR